MDNAHSQRQQPMKSPESRDDQITFTFGISIPTESPEERKQDDTTVLSSERVGDRFNSLKSLACENYAHDFYPEWTGEECDHDSFMCFSEGVNQNCCKCRPECCGQCNVLANFNDPYQACPALASKALADARLAQTAGEATTMQMIYIALGAIFVLGALAALCGLPSYLEERERMKLLVKDEKETNLRAYRDEAEDADGVYKEDEPHR